LFILSCDIFDNNNQNEELCIKIAPEEATIAIGEELILEVELEDVDDLYAMSVEIVFDAAILTLADEPLILGDDWGDEVISTYVSEMDRINIAIGLTNSEDVEMDGDMELFKIKLLGVDTGQSMVNIHNLNIYNDDGELIEDFAEIEIENAMVRVQ
jgi:hypothetical protein